MANIKNVDKRWKLPPCYIYLYHTDEWFQLPQYPESIADSLESNFSSQNALARTAPVFSYNNSGPRTIQITLDLHRDLMNSINAEGSCVHYQQGNDIITSPRDDYVDILVKKLQSIALPRYQSSNKMINPPKVALRFGNDIFIKGVVASGGVTVTYGLPILENNKYAKISISFNVTETEPFDADSVGQLGSFRGLTSGLRQKMGYRDTSVHRSTANTNITNMIM